MQKIVLLLIVAISVSGADAAEPFAGEIEDGSWVKYRVSVGGGDVVNMELETTIKAVGRTQELGEDCQWIEVGSVDTTTGERMEVFKLLFRERDLKRRDVSITEVVRAWMLARDSDQPMEASEIQLAGLTLLFPGELDDRQRAEETETVDLEGESLECEVLEGETEVEFGEQSASVSHRYLLHDDIPFGLAGFRKEIRLMPSGQQIVADAQLVEVGGDAESLLPDSR